VNFLAHIYLSGSLQHVQLGNFIGDFVKGNQLSAFPVPMQAGIVLHRFIDTFTDTHEVVKQSKIRLRENFGHYAPVIVDVFYDHYLARDWQKHHSVALKEFTEDFYKLTRQEAALLPEKCLQMLQYMSSGNWLYHYQYTEGIRRALTGMSQRTSFTSNMELAHLALEKHYTEFENEFNQFFPLLKAECANHLEELKNRFSF